MMTIEERAKEYVKRYTLPFVEGKYEPLTLEQAFIAIQREALRSVEVAASDEVVAE